MNPHGIAPDWRLTCAGYNREVHAAAAQLLAQREHGYPRQVAAGKLTQADADAKLRVMRAVVAVWAAMTADRDLPPAERWNEAFGASADEMVDELRLAYAAVRRASDAAPGDEPRFNLAGAVSSLLFDHEPQDGRPRLLHFHAHYQAAHFVGRHLEAA